MSNTNKHWDTIIIGAGAAGLFCAAQLGKVKKNILIIERANKAGKKILMSGGGRCNFTNLNIQFDRYLSNNPHFCKSALSRYTQWDFISLVEKYNIPYHEKTLGQLFCDNKSQQILDMLLSECKTAKVTIKLKQDIHDIKKVGDLFLIEMGQHTVRCKNLVIATGGLSIPTLGGSPFGYEIARKFKHTIIPTKAGLVPLTFHNHDKDTLAQLSGISVLTDIEYNHIRFRENILFTHRGLSGPAVLQISSYWQPGQPLKINLLPTLNLSQHIAEACKNSPKQSLKKLLGQHLAKRLLEIFLPLSLLDKPVQKLHAMDIQSIEKSLQHWQFLPNGTEGYRTAEVTLGGVNVNEVCSKTFESKLVKNMYFIGEVLDVSGWLGGYNFQWAWSSAYACAQELATIP